MGPEEQKRIQNLLVLDLEEDLWQDMRARDDLSLIDIVSGELGVGLCDPQPEYIQEHADLICFALEVEGIADDDGTGWA